MGEQRDDAQHAIPPRSDYLAGEVKQLRELITQQGSPFSKLRLEAQVRSWTNNGKRKLTANGREFTLSDMKAALNRCFDTNSSQEIEIAIASLPNSLRGEVRATLNSKREIALLRKENPDRYGFKNHDPATALDLDELWIVAGEQTGVCDQTDTVFDQESTRQRMNDLFARGELSPRGMYGQFAMREAMFYKNNKFLHTLNKETFLTKFTTFAPWVNQEGLSEQQPTFTRFPPNIMAIALEVA